MEHLTDEQLAQLRKRLMDERNLLLKQEVDDSRRAEAGDGEPGDSQDRARRERERSDQFYHQHHVRERLEEIDAALARISQGTYGICEETGEPIPHRRLESQPTARYTVEAQEMIEEQDQRAMAQGPAAY